MDVREYGCWVDGKWWRSGEKREHLSPQTGQVITHRHEASAELLEKAIASSRKAFETYRSVSRDLRSRLLMLVAEGLASRREEIARSIMNEAGKPITLALGEVGRAIVTFTSAAEEAKRWGGEVVPVDIESQSRDYDPALVYWVPRGPVLAISPFNFPLNLAAHKVAPALACGATVLLKPPPQAAGAAVILAEIFAAAAMRASDARESVPLAAFQVVHASNQVMEAAVRDSRLPVLSFTGSQSVGWLLQEKAIRKRVILELGGNAAVIVHRDADLKRAAARCAYGAFAYAGQICISVQQIWVDDAVREDFQRLLLEETARIKTGDPADPATLNGPVIDRKAADRLENWVKTAVASGARLLCGGGRNGLWLDPVVLTGAGRAQNIVSEEAFGPVVNLDSYSRIEEAILGVNQSRFGLQAGVFTDSAAIIRKVRDSLEVGGILINEVPTYRSDVMPYGGVKESGLGREGIRYAMESYSERRTLVAWRG